MMTHPGWEIPDEFSQLLEWTDRLREAGELSVLSEGLFN